MNKSFLLAVLAYGSLLGLIYWSYETQKKRFESQQTKTDCRIEEVDQRLVVIEDKAKKYERLLQSPVVRRLIGKKLD